MTFRKPSNATAIGTLKYHRSLLADPVRTNAYRAAIEATVRPGDVVVDLGCGTGVLSFFACLAGARRVYAIDELPVINLAREVARDNGLADRITFLQQSSYDVTIPEPVDVLVTETIGNNGFDEQIISAAAHAKKTWLREGGIILPATIELHAAPVELPDVHDAQTLWTSHPYGIDYTRLRGYALNAFHPMVIAPTQLLAPSALLATVTIGDDTPNIRGTATFTIQRDATLHGLAVWFRAHLTDTIAITNEPPTPSHSWKQSFFPITEPLTVRSNDTIPLTLQTYDGLEWRWHLANREQTTLHNFP
ncbi:MAG: type protein arginine methyltransferase, partial [Acidobacteriota bacterium]|nr:type protein arginine methyltransferase [Acidobacteriota bacterium]